MNGEGLAKSFGDSPQSHVLTITANVTNPDDWKKMVELAKDKFGGVDILINNAGELRVLGVTTILLICCRDILQEQANHGRHRSRIRQSLCCQR